MNSSQGSARVLVTGGAAGIGRSIAEAFAASGAQVYVCDVSVIEPSPMGADRHPMLTSVTDISDRAAVDRMFEDVADRLGGLDVLVNNAGIAGPTAPVELVDPDDWERVFAVNIHGAFLCARRAIPLLKGAGGGSIVNIASVAGRLPYALRSAYSCSKWAMVGFTQCLAVELGGFGIRANAILPGIVRGARRLGNSKRRAALAGVTVEDIEAASLARVATGRMVEPDEVAEMALFLASEAARNVTGQSISVCGYVQALIDPVRP